MVPPSWSRRLSILALGGVLVIAGASLSLSQTKKPKEKEKPKKEPNAVQVRTLETQAEKAKTEYVTGLLAVAKGFEEQGLPDRTKETLQAILEVVPDFEAAREKLKEIDEKAFNENTFETEVDATKGWVNSGIAVMKDKPMRLEADGTLRVILNETVDPDGLPSGDPLLHQVVGIPTGALMGVVRDPRNATKNDKINPFTVGKDMEFSPKAEGILFFKLNLPANTVSKGKYRVKISGNFQKITGTPG